MHKYVYTSSLFLSLFVISTFFIRCGSNENSRKPQDTSSQELSIHWIDKVAQRLRQGEGLNEHDDLSLLRTLSKEEVIDYFMKDQKFIDTVFDFSLYFLGLKSSTNQWEKGLFLETYGFGNSWFAPAVAAAQAFSEEKDYFTLMDLEQTPFAVPGPKYAFNDGPEGPEIIKFDLQDYKKRLEDFFGQSKRELIAFAGGRKKDFCLYYSAISDNEIVYELRWIFSFYSYREKQVDIYCSTSEETEGEETLDSRYISIAVTTLDQYLNVVRTIANDFDPRTYVINGVLDYKKIPSNLFPSKKMLDSAAQRWFWKRLPNSSTNMNRKRASYILKRYFCDNLDPVNIEQPQQHSNDAHASQPSCRSCHYKLDPMAGFFRNFGRGGADFSGADEIFFDDFATKPRKEYVSQWKEGDAWNIGYIRSTTDHSKNSYPSVNKENPGLADLVQILRSAPEVKRCLVRRGFEYFVSEDVNLDTGYLDHLTDEFTKEKNSSGALKKTIKTMLLSQSFAHPAPEAGSCYDFAPNTDLTSRPPCGIAGILEANCISCHGEGSSLGGLDLSRWVGVPGGRGFVHLDENGDQIPWAESFQKIKDRLSSRDPELRMPLSRYMSSQDRQKLFKWFDERINQ